MIQSTVDRLGSLVPGERQLVITNKILVDAIREQLPTVPPENVVGEPCKRDNRSLHRVSRSHDSSQ